MAKIIKVLCTGPGQHENEIDLEDVIGSDVVIYGGPIAARAGTCPRGSSTGAPCARRGRSSSLAR